MYINNTFYICYSSHQKINACLNIEYVINWYISSSFMVILWFIHVSFANNTLQILVRVEYLRQTRFSRTKAKDITWNAILSFSCSMSVHVTLPMVVRETGLIDYILPTVTFWLMMKTVIYLRNKLWNRRSLLT